MPKFHVIKGEALDYDVYLGSAPLKTLAKISFPDRAVMDSAEGAQRELKKRHAKDFAEFIKNPNVHNLKKASAPPLIFSARVKLKFHEIEDGFGTLTVSDDEHALAQVDGQHRLAQTGSVEKSLPFVIYQDLEPTEEMGLFTVINDQHEGLTKSLVDKNTAQLLGDDLPEKKPHLDIAVKLNEEKKSPWHHLVDTGGEKTPGTKRRVTLRSLQEATREMISGPRCQNANSVTKLEVVMNFWKGVVATFPKEWEKPRNHLLTKGVGVRALAAVGRDIIEERVGAGDYTPEAFEKALGKLSGFDWGNKTSVFAAWGGQKGVKLATILLNKIIFGNLAVTDVWDEAKKIAH
jgi:DGQHR domain-containing protein